MNSAVTTHTGTTELPAVGAEALAAELRAQIRGEVRFDAGSQALYATDASNYRQVPIGVVIPRDEEDVMETLAACRHHGARRALAAREAARGHAQDQGHERGLRHHAQAVPAEGYG